MNHVLGNLTNKQIISISYNTSIYKKNLDYGVVAMATLNVEATQGLTVGYQYSYSVDSRTVGIFVCKQVKKSGNKYSITLYDKACLLTAEQRQQYEEDEEHFYYFNSAGAITAGTYATTSSANFTEADFFSLDVDLSNVQGYNALTLNVPDKKNLILGRKFTAGGYTGYVQSLSWDAATYTISCQVAEEDNAESQIEQVESQILQQGSLITELTVEQGIIQAKVERKNAVYKQATEPADTEGEGEETKYDLLNTGDAWYYTGTTTETRTNGKWYVCTATGKHETGDRSVVWTLTEDATISQNSARITVTEDAIEQEVIDRQTAINGERTYLTTNYSTTTQTATEIATKVGEAKEEMEDYTDDAVAGERTYLTNNYSTTSQTATNISNAVLEETTRATTAENGKLDTSSTTTGFGWNLTSTDWTVNKISGSTTTPIFKVNSNGATVKGTISADEGYIGKLSLSNGWLTATESTSQGILLQKGTTTSANDFELTNLRTNGLSYNYGPVSSPTTSVTIGSLGVTTNKLRLISATVDATSASVTMTGGSITASERLVSNHLCVSGASYGTADPSGGNTGDIYFKL